MKGLNDPMDSGDDGDGNNDGGDSIFRHFLI